MRIAGILMLARAFDVHAGVHVVQEIAAQETEEERKAYVDEFLRKSIETQKALGISVGKDDELDGQVSGKRRRQRAKPQLLAGRNNVEGTEEDIAFAQRARKRREAVGAGGLLESFSSTAPSDD